ncbi:MAG: amino acid permease [Alphaproteobacteria bacterium]|nr:amino acid permease [Alphaproteobacteria bacterium]OJV16248.1 MAG: hypothetical protein BGO27_04485 [Alphaproteobacteria bacterium 33-17]
MKKLIGSTCLVAGTCIGAGMIALPIVLAKIGIVMSMVMLIAVWGVTYLASLMTLELNLRAGEGKPLGLLGRHFGGLKAEIVGIVCLKLLAYSLLSAYLYGGTSVISKLLAMFNVEASNLAISWVYFSVILVILSLPLKLLDYTNRILFAGLITVLSIVISILMLAIYKFDFAIESTNLISVSESIAVIFTSFGFQIVSHSLTNYCNKDAKILKKAFFFGSLVPLLIYIVWTIGVITIVKQADPAFYKHMLHNSVDVGDLVAKISQGASSNYLKELIWAVSVLAIITSALGVGMGLLDSWEKQLNISAKNLKKHVALVLVTLVPPFLIASYIPNAFISALSFAGIVNVIIVLVLPMYLLIKSDHNGTGYFYPVLKSKLIKGTIIILAVFVLSFELITKV